MIIIVVAIILYKRTKLVRAFWLAKILWFIVQVDSEKT